MGTRIYQEKKFRLTLLYIFHCIEHIITSISLCNSFSFGFQAHSWRAFQIMKWILNTNNFNIFYIEKLQVWVIDPYLPELMSLKLYKINLALFYWCSTIFSMDSSNRFGRTRSPLKQTNDTEDVENGRSVLFAQYDFCFISINYRCNCLKLNVIDPFTCYCLRTTGTRSYKFFL